MTSIALLKSPMNFEGGREVPHILYTKVAPTARRILVIGESNTIDPISDIWPDPSRRPPVRLLNVHCAPPILLTAGVIASIEACDAASVLDRCDRHVGRNRPGNAPVSQQVMIV